MLHITEWFGEPETDELKICICEGVSDRLPGVTETITGGISVTWPLADLEESAALVAVTVTTCFSAIVAGAV